MADKELQRVRREFVNRVQEDVLGQLVDDLLEDNVMNNGEKNAVMQVTKTCEEKARLLIDKVRLKGPKASEKLISRLKERDSALYELLGLAPPPEPPAPSPAPPQPEDSAASPGLRHCSAEFMRDLLERKGREIYPLKEKGQRKRVALLINNVQFALKSWERKGADKDEENMEKLLKDLDYTVETHRNLSAKAIDEAVKRFSQREEHLESDSTFVVIMSHGKRDAICGIHYDPDDPEGKDDLFSIDNIFTHLNTKNCKGLRDKPKVIVIQACRGKEKGTVWVSDDATERPALEDDSIRKELQEKDFVCLMSCTPDTKSYRDTVQGALMIQKLVKTVNEDAHKDHIEELFRKVKKKFEDLKLQMPTTDRTTLVNKFYLFPGF